MCFPAVVTPVNRVEEEERTPWSPRIYKLDTALEAEPSHSYKRFSVAREAKNTLKM